MVNKGWYFLALVVLCYAALAFFDVGMAASGLNRSSSLLVKILPVFLFVFGVMIITNYFVSGKKVKKYLGKTSGWRKWLIAIFAGILSMGPIYMWYPLLRDLQKQGASNGFLAAFLYNRAVKPFLLPIMIFYFGLGFTFLLTVLMIAASVLNGFIFEALYPKLDG